MTNDTVSDSTGHTSTTGTVPSDSTVHVQSTVLPHGRTSDMVSSDNTVQSTDVLTVLPHGCTSDVVSLDNTCTVQSTYTVLPLTCASYRVSSDNVALTSTSGTVPLNNAVPSSLTVTQAQSHRCQCTFDSSLGRAKKHRRTVSVRKHYTDIQPGELESSNDHVARDCFDMSEVERKSMEEFKIKTLLYTTAKLSIDNDQTEYVLNDIRMFLSTTTELDQSIVYYFELINEYPDSDEAMLKVIDDLMNKFEDNSQHKHILLIGDGKTYQHLMSIKDKYSSTLNKLYIIFPGDWHILKIFQIVLMKIYYCAGLKELGANSGYHGQTLKSLENAGSFK